MNAEEARKLAKDSITGPIVGPYLKMIEGKIRKAAAHGRFSVCNPFAGVRMTYPSPDAQEEIWRQLKEDGYKVTHHPDPDPGHPASGPYTEISW